MNYVQANAAAHRASNEHPGCIFHVCARVLNACESGTGEPIIDPKGYTVSDWYDGTVVATYLNGRCRED